MEENVAEAAVQSAHVDRLQTRVDEIDVSVQPIDGERLNRRVITAGDDELEERSFSSEKTLIDSRCIDRLQMGKQTRCDCIQVVVSSPGIDTSHV